MRNKTKKLLSFVAAATMLASTLAITACGDYKLDETLTLPETSAKVDSNGGFAVEKDGYVYFINGAEDYTANNTYGDVVKGALMRIKKTDLMTNPGAAEMVVPTLVGSQNFETGIYIYGDYVYYATPTTDKNIQGVVENSWIDFKRAKLDGSKTMKGYYFRLSSNTANYRFVEVEGVVYCLYEEGGMLKSYNTAEGTTSVLVKGASSYFYNEEEPTNANVYYTMGVTYDLDSDKATTATYNQIYCVNAAATATVNAKEASYTVKDGRTYDFDKEHLEKQNDEARDAANDSGTDYEATYVFDDYSTYPYVNLGKLVVDGVGSKCEVYDAASGAKIPYNDSAETNGELQGYKYTIQRYENGGVYYTRNDSSKLYYYNETTDTNTTAKAVKANEAADIVALNTTKASTSALFDIVSGEHQYIYISGNNIYRATANADGTLDNDKDVKLCGNASGKTLWKATDDGYLYYYGSGESTSGNQLTRINYKGTAAQYDTILNLDETEEYRPVTVGYVDFASSWYMPELLGNTLLYANAKSIGSSSYNYVYATELGTADDIKANNELYEEVQTYMEEELTVDMKNAATYLFRTYKRGVEDDKQWFFEDYENVQTEYQAKNDKEISWIDEFEDATDGAMTLLKNGTYKVESDFINMIGAYSEDDEEAIRESWQSYLPFPAEEEEEEGLAWWAITLIVVGSVLVVAAGVTVPLVILHQKKLKKAEEDATVNAYKRPKIDTTDDKSIDVYADDEAVAPATETSENE